MVRWDFYGLPFIDSGNVKLLVKSPETFQTAAAQYLKFRRRSRIAFWIFWVSYVGWIPVLFLGSFTQGWGALVPPIVIVVSLFLRWRYKKLANEALPTIEAKTRVFQQLAVKSLAAFIENNGKSFRKACLKNLRTAASFIDDWSIGNLQFLQRQFSDKMEDFKKAFRFRLIPAIEKAEAKSKITELIYQWLTVSVQNELLGGFDGVRLDAWNNFLSPFKPIQPKGMWRRLASRIVMYHIAYLLSVTIAAYAYFGVQRNILGADVNTATNGLNVILGILLAPYAVYLFSKYQSRKGPKTQ